MSEDFEFDSLEYARQLAYTEDLGRGDLSKPEAIEEGRGLTRRDLLVKGGVGAAAVAGLGALAGPAVAKTSSSGKFTGTLRVLSLGVEWPFPDVEKQAEKDLGFKIKVDLVSSEAQPQIAITQP